MGEITGPDDRNPFFPCPGGEMFGIQASGGGAGVVGMDMEIGNEFHVGLIAKLLLRTHIRWCKDPITGRELMLDPGCWIPENMKRLFDFIQHPATSIQDLSNYSTGLDIKIELNLKKLK